MNKLDEYVDQGKPAINLITMAYKANLPVLLTGKHGISKSEMFKAAASALGISCIARDLSVMEPTDLIGLPDKRDGRTHYCPPSFLPKEGKGLLVFEELNRSDRCMMAPCLQLLTDRSLNDYRLPEGWLPVASINPPEDGYDVNELDPALLSRFLVIKMRACNPEWLRWAKDNKIHPAVISYIEKDADVFTTTNPRSWTYVSNLLSKNEEASVKDPVLLSSMRYGIISFVGQDHGISFWAEYTGRSSKAAKVEEIIADYSCVKPTILDWKKQRKTSLLENCAHEMKVKLQCGSFSSAIAASPAKQKNLTAFIRDLPGELGNTVKRKAQQYGALT